MVDKSKWGVHRTHCCKNHGCKYGNDDCPVELGIIEQDYSCMDDNISDPCFDETIDFQMKYGDFKEALEKVEKLTRGSSNGEIFIIHEIVKNALN